MLLWCLSRGTSDYSHFYSGISLRKHMLLSFIREWQKRDFLKQLHLGHFKPSIELKPNLTLCTHRVITTNLLGRLTCKTFSCNLIVCHWGLFAHLPYLVRLNWSLVCLLPWCGSVIQVWNQQSHGGQTKTTRWSLSVWLQTNSGTVGLWWTDLDATPATGSTFPFGMK